MVRPRILKINGPNFCKRDILRTLIRINVALIIELQNVAYENKPSVLLLIYCKYYKKRLLQVRPIPEFLAAVEFAEKR